MEKRIIITLNKWISRSRDITDKLRNHIFDLLRSNQLSVTTKYGLYCHRQLLNDEKAKEILAYLKHEIWSFSGGAYLIPAQELLKHVGDDERLAELDGIVLIQKRDHDEYTIRNYAQLKADMDSIMYQHINNF